MRKLMKERGLLVLVAVGFAMAAIVTPSFAGTVHHWITEDGTAAYTDDVKRIPAKYREQATKLQLGKLKNYERYSESKVKFAVPYEKRVDARIERLRGPSRTGMPAVSAAPPDDGVRFGLGLSRSDNDVLSFPIDETSGEPIVTSEHRIRMNNSIATQDVQVTKQGDRVVSVRIAAPNQRKINERVDDATARAIARER